MIKPFVIGTMYCFRKKEDIALFHVCEKGENYIKVDFTFRVESYTKGIIMNDDIRKASNATSFFFSSCVSEAEDIDYKDAIRFLFKYGDHLIY